MIKIILSTFFVCFAILEGSAQLQLSDNRKFLIGKDGKPFFWLADTDWELFRRLNREETENFINTRKDQGFNVLLAGALTVNDYSEQNRYGDYPFRDEDPTQLAVTPGNNPNNSDEYDYWDHIDFIINKAAEKGMYIGLLPAWKDKVVANWAEGLAVLNTKNAEVYGKILATRYAMHWNVLWILGGDCPATYRRYWINWDDRPIWRAMANGIEDVLGKEAFITYHPSAGPNSTSQNIHEETWLDMNAFQSGHKSRTAEAWDYVVRDLLMRPQKPTLDIEPCYEDHPVNPFDGKWTRQRGYFTAYDVRARIYRGIFAGACGVTYGHHQVWQFLNTALYKPIDVGDTLIGWQKALRAKAAGQMQHVKNLMLSRPYYTRVADQSIIKSDKVHDYTDLVYATMDENKSYAMIYLPQNRPVKVDLSKISGATKNIWWFDVQTGKATIEKSVVGNGTIFFTPPKHGIDWVLVIDDASKKFDAPGTIVGQIN